MHCTAGNSSFVEGYAFPQPRRRWNSLRRGLAFVWMLAFCLAGSFSGASVVQAQQFRFSLRAEPDLIPANGTSSTSIFVQVQNASSGSISAQPVVRFATTLGVIESQTRLYNGSARVLLRSSATPGTAIVTAFIGTAREQVTVEFSNDTRGLSRFWQIKGQAVSFGAERNVITASGPCSFEFGDLHLESDTRLDVDVQSQRIWAEGNPGKVIIRDGLKKKELRGDRLYFDLRRRRGVMRRTDESLGPLRQEFIGSDFAPPAALNDGDAELPTAPPAPVAPPSSPAARQAHNETPAAPETPNPIVPVKAGAASEVPHAGANSNAASNPEASATIEESTAPRAVDKANDGIAPVATPSSPTFALRPVSFAAAASPQIQLTGATVSSVKADSSEQALLAELPRKSGPKSDSDDPDDGGPDESRDTTPPAPPEYKPLPEQGRKSRVAEPDPPKYSNQRGYWVVSRWMRVFPNDKLQFGKATVFYNARRLFYMRLYVAPLDGSFNPATNMIGVNSTAGLSLRIPYYYQASPRGTGAVYLVNAPRNGFSAEQPGLSLAMEHDYWFSNKNQGKFQVDSIGKGDWNMRWDHRIQFSPTTRGAFYVSMPDHKDAYLSSSLSKEFKSFDVGLETFYARPRGGASNMQGSFYARLRPKPIGNSGWMSTVTATMTGLQKFYATAPDGTVATKSQPLYGQIVSANLIAPTYKLWKGASFDTTVTASAYNYSNGKRGTSPGLTMGLQQFLGKKALVRLDYTYDRGAITPQTNGYYSTSSNFLNASAQVNLGSKVFTNFFWSRGLNDGSQYGYSTIDYYFTSKWRAGLFSDYSKFDSLSYLNYGVSLGRTIGNRELSLNWDKDRNRFYFEFGNFFN